MQQDHLPHKPLTQERIRQVLEWRRVTQNARSDNAAALKSSEDDPTALNDYHRLMEIYCLVKIGGVTGQIEAAQALLAREKQSLEAEIAALDSPDAYAGRISLLKQEIVELENSTRWRIAQLEIIQAEEERAVTHCISAIENALQDFQ